MSLLLGSLGGCKSPPPARPDLILISLDTVRADTFAALSGPDSPWASLLEGAVRYAAVTPTPLTLPAHTSLLSGLQPHRHGVRNNGQRVSNELPVLGEWLQSAGYRTAAVVSAFPLDRQFGLARGFQHYDQPEAPEGVRSGFATVERPAADSVDALLRALDDPDPRPAFLWLHLFDAHAPYAAPGSDPALPARTRYADEIQYMGTQLQRLDQRLRARSRPYVLVLVADHGEGLGDHGELDHGLLLHESTLRVPMVWVGDPRFVTRTMTSTPRLVDVAPTMLTLAGVDVPADLDGVSLLPGLLGQDQDLPDAYAETYYPRYAYRAAPLRSVYREGWKLIATTDASALYHLPDDPGETLDRALQEPIRTEQLHFDAWERPEPVLASGPSDPATLQKLRSLGYVSAPAEPADAAHTQPHPRTVVEVHRRLVELQELLGHGEAEQAETAASALIDAHPAYAFPWFVRAELRMERGVPGEAVMDYTQALRLDELNPQTRYRLAEALMQTGQWLAALEQWQALEVMDPERVAVWTNQAVVLARLEQWEAAWTAITQALQRAPDDPAAIDNGIVIGERLGRWQAVTRWYALQAAQPDFQRQGQYALAALRAGELSTARSLTRAVSPQQPQAAALWVVQAVLALRDSDEARRVAAVAQLARHAPAALAQARRMYPQALR